MNHRMNKTIWLMLISALLLLYLSGCSTVKNIIGWVNPWASDKTRAGVTSKDITQFVSKVRSNGGNPDSHYLLACYYQERGKHKEAIEEFRKVLFIDPNYVRAYNGLGVSYDLLGDFPRAIESYKNALKLNPNLDYVQNNLGYSYLLQENFDEAMAAFKRAMELNDKDKRFHNNLGLAYAEKGLFDLALSEFKLAGEEAKAHYNIAQVYLKKGLYNEAMSYYTTALRLDPFLTCARTALEAASTLSRVFHSDTKSAKAEELVIPEKPNQIPPSPPFLKGGEEGFGLTPVEVKAEKSIAQDELAESSTRDRLETANAVATIFLPATKEAEPEELAVPESVSVAPDTFELQVASFRSKEIADLSANSLRESGYRTTVKDWKDEKGREWHRLFTGPFVTKDEALTRKVRIEKEYKFGPMIVQSKAVPERRSACLAEAATRRQALRNAGVKTQAEEVVVHSTGKSSLNSMRDVEIEISNGNGVNGMARRVGDYLKGKRLRVVRLTNANNFNYTETRIFYQEGFRQAADHMADQLPVIRTMEELKRFDRANIKVKLVIGKDLIQHNKLLEVEPTGKALPARWSASLR